MKVSSKAHIFGKVLENAETLSYEQAKCLLREELSEEAKNNDVFFSHLEILDDPLLEENIQIQIANGVTQEIAVHKAADKLAAMFSEIDDEFFRARTDDVRDVCRRLEMKIAGKSRCTNIPDGCIIVAEELLPSDIATIDFAKVRGILCRKGSNTSHVVIMIHSKGIPIEIGRDISTISEGQIVSVSDSSIGGEVVEILRREGKMVYANAGSLEEIKTAMDAGADGIGLFRTEFIYLNADEAPSLEAQTEVYRKAMSLCKGKVLIVRTMDIGGDKNVPWMGLPHEDNPFLGVRGIRFCLVHPELLQTQLKALAMAAKMEPECELKIMFPMVCSADEVKRAKALLSSEADGLCFGAMIETPSAALDIENLCENCEFFSIGSNDLTQYVMAADRGNPAVSEYYDPMSAAVKRIIKIIVTEAHKHDAHVGICGEMASDPAAMQFLLETGVDSFSLNSL